MLALVFVAAMLGQTADVRVLVTEKPQDLRVLQVNVLESAMRDCVENGRISNLTKLCADRDVYTSCEIWQGQTSTRCLGSHQKPVCNAIAKQFVRKYSEWTHVCFERNDSRFGWVATDARGIMTVPQAEADRLVARERATILGRAVP
jgi:hypothetical protein